MFATRSNRVQQVFESCFETETSVAANRIRSTEKRVCGQRAAQVFQQQDFQQVLSGRRWAKKVDRHG